MLVAENRCIAHARSALPFAACARFGTRPVSVGERRRRPHSARDIAPRVASFPTTGAQPRRWAEAAPEGSSSAASGACSTFSNVPGSGMAPSSNF
jgi:hypothetical protein